MEMVATLNQKMDKILFFEEVKNIKRFTILRQQKNDKFFIYCNKTKLIAELKNFKISKINNIQLDILDWRISNLFFETTSMIVKNWQVVEQKELIRMYSTLNDLRAMEIQNRNSCYSIINGNYRIGAKINAIYMLFKIKPRGVVKSRIRRLGLIW